MLVGSNPLPNYLVACALRPERVALVYTSQTSDAKNRLQVQLQNALGNQLQLQEKFIQNAARVTDVKGAIESLMQGHDNQHVHLNYTGGTKVMAAHALLAFRDRGGKPENASYLDEVGDGQEPLLRFDSGREKRLSELNNIPPENGNHFRLAWRSSPAAKAQATGPHA